MTGNREGPGTGERVQLHHQRNLLSLDDLDEASGVLSRDALCVVHPDCLGVVHHDCRILVYHVGGQCTVVSRAVVCVGWQDATSFVLRRGQAGKAWNFIHRLMEIVINREPAVAKWAECRVLGPGSGVEGKGSRFRVQALGATRPACSVK